MKLGIMHVESSFSTKWLRYCKRHKIQYKLVKVYQSDVIEQLNDCDGFMWHINHKDYRDKLFAKQLIFSLERKGMKVFPNSNTSWHFDDKIGQKYLLEAQDLPFVNSYSFYEKKEALNWLKVAEFPKVFKLKSGAGSYNVHLIKTRKKALNTINKAFGKGFYSINKFAAIKEALWKFQRDKNMKSVLRIVKKGFELAYKSENDKLIPKEKGYIYFQDFIPNNKFDDRIIVIGDRLFCVRRHCRENDFRASGSGIISYDRTIFSKEAMLIAFEISNKLETQAIAIDFVYKDKNPLIVEICFGFSTDGTYEKCDGYFDRNLKWIDENVRPENFIIEDFIKSINSG